MTTKVFNKFNSLVFFFPEFHMTIDTACDYKICSRIDEYLLEISQNKIDTPDIVQLDSLGTN